MLIPCSSSHSCGMHVIVTTFSIYGVCETPKPQSFLNIITGVAKHHFKGKPAYFISEMKAAVPDQHIPFWNQLSCEEFYSIYMAQQASAVKVLAMLEDPQASNPNKERVLVTCNNSLEACVRMNCDHSCDSPQEMRYVAPPASPYVSTIYRDLQGDQLATPAAIVSSCYLLTTPMETSNRST